MKKYDLEERIRKLETALDRFDGVPWILGVGEIARLKDVILDMPGSGSAQCTACATEAELARIDRAIAAATDSSRPDRRAQTAFTEAAKALGHCLAAQGPV